MTMVLSRTGHRLVAGALSVRDAADEDLRTDPYLKWILLLATVCSGAFVWYRLPNFAAPDEYARVLKPMKVAGRMAQEGPSGLRSGLLADRALGPTVYLYAASLAPVFFVVVLSGSLGQFTDLGELESRWDLWQATPAWFWTTSVLLARLWSVLFSVGAVYVVYRTAAETHGRLAGRYAATSLALSLGFVAAGHEAAEDAPLVFLTALVVYLAVRYVRSGTGGYFFAGCAVGGFATAFKFSGGITAVVLGAAYLLRETRRDGRDRPPVDGHIQLLGGGLVLALVAFYLGFAAAVVGGPGVLYDRVANEFGRHVGSGGSTESTLPFFGYGVLYAFLNGLGLPLFLAAVAGILAGVRWIARERTDAVVAAVVLPALAAFVAVFLVAGDPATRHLLPAYPMVLVLVGGAMAAAHHRGSRATHVVLAAVVVLSAAYTGAGLLVFADEPRDAATRTLATETDSDDEVLVYANSVTEVGAVHGRPLTHYAFDEANATGPLVRDASDYTDWMTSSPDRGPAVIQLTCSETVSYLTPEQSEQYPERATFVDGLLSGDDYDYRVLARHGTAPRTYIERRTRHPVRRLADAGLVPRPGNTEPCVVLLEQTG